MMIHILFDLRNQSVPTIAELTNDGSLCIVWNSVSAYTEIGASVNGSKRPSDLPSRRSSSHV
jgi:hypothetical protein